MTINLLYIDSDTRQNDEMVISILFHTFFVILNHQLSIFNHSLHPLKYFLNTPTSIHPSYEIFRMFKIK